MKNNEGTMDRVIRMLVGAVVLSLAFTRPHPALGYIGLAPPNYPVRGLLSGVPSHGAQHVLAAEEALN
jgi:hypothetical protein